MRTRLSLCLVVLVMSLTGCEKERRVRRSSARGGGSMAAATNATTSAAAFAFLSIDEALTAARLALKEEKWDDAVAAARQALSTDPSSTEAKEIEVKAAAESQNKAAYEALVTAVGRTDLAGLELV